jgi:hypothetical protein
LNTLIKGYQIHGHILKDEVGEVCNGEAFIELNDVGMVDTLMQELDLPVNYVLNGKVLVSDFLDGDDVAGVDIDGFMDCTVCTRSNV